MASPATPNSFTYTCTMTVTGDVTNVATTVGRRRTITARRSPGTNPVTDNDDAVVDAINPSIMIEKTPDLQHVVVGQTATFTIVVTNTGDVALSGVTVTRCRGAELQRAAGSIPLLLASPRHANSFTYTCTMTVTGDVTNVATTVGQPPVGTPIPCADGRQRDSVVDASTRRFPSSRPPVQRLQIQTPDGDTYYIPSPGAPVVYQFVVTNTGDTNFINVSITDDKLGFICGPFSLPIGQSTTCNGTPTFIGQDVTNVGTATGTPADAAFVAYPGIGPITDTDPAVVDVYLAQYTIEKTLVSPANGEARPGDPIQFKIHVKNTGDVYLGVVPLIDTFDPAYLAYVGVSASPAPNGTAPTGTLTWNDLTAATPNGFNTDLVPGASFDILVDFTALADTSAILPDGKTINTAR